MANNPLIPAGTPNDGFSENWKPVEEPVFTAPSSPPAAFSSGSPSPFFAGSIPLSHQLVPDIMPTRYPGGIGGYRVSPPIPAASAGINSAVKSIVDEVAAIGFVDLKMPMEFAVNEATGNPEVITVAWVPELASTFLAGPIANLPVLTFNSISANNHASGSPQTSYTITVTATSPGIEVGDTAFASVSMGSGVYTDPLTISTVIDSLGNRWMPLSSQFNFTVLTTVSGQVAQIWYAVMEKAVPASGTFTLTATYGGGTSSSLAAIYFYNAPGSVMGTLQAVTNQDYPLVSAPAVGGPITIPGSGILMQWAMVGAGSLPSMWTHITNPSSGVYGFVSFAVAPAGTYSTSQAGSANSGGYVAMASFSLSSSIVTSAIPAFRYIVPSDLPPINLASTTNGGVTGILPIASGGTGTAAPSLVAGTNVTISGSWPDQTINAAAGFANPMTTKGDIIYEDATPAPNRLPIGSPAQVLTVVSGLPSWQNASSGFANPMTTKGDLIFENAAPAPDRLPVGTNGQVLTVVSGLPAWASGGGSGTPFLTSVVDSNAIAYSPAAHATKGNVVTAVQAVTIYRMFCNINGNSGDVYQAAILTMSSGTVISGILATSNTFTFPSTEAATVVFTFASPPALTPGDIYLFCIQITSGTGTTSANIADYSNTNCYYPGCVPTNSFGTVSSTNPSSGSLTTSGSGCYNIYAIMSI